MSGNKNHKTEKGVIRPDQTVEYIKFESVLPDPETLKKYEELHPGCTKLWMEIAASEIASRQKSEDRVTWTFKYSTITGQILAFLSTLVISGVAVYCIYMGNSTAGAVIITGSAASIIAAYLVRKSGQSKKDS